MNKKTSVKPVIEDGEIVKLEIEEVSLPLRQPLTLDELPQLIAAVEGFFRYVDVEKLGETLAGEGEELGEWEDEDLRKFVLTKLRDSQAAALRVLTDSNQVTREQFIAKMKKLLDDDTFRGWSLGGLLAGITMKSKSLDNESPYESEWRTAGNKWKCFYYLTRDRYKPIIKKALEERST